MLCRLLYCVFVCFKQKTAYEVRISDWSSDVCSSDLAKPQRPFRRRRRYRHAGTGGEGAYPHHRPARILGGSHGGECPRRRRDGAARALYVRGDPGAGADGAGRHRAGRSEEHTSELQSLMRISYAVFCLKKKRQPEKRNKKTT